MLITWGIVSLLMGIGIIASTFIVQRIENKNRMDGYYTTATVTELKRNEKKGLVTAVFEFSMDYKKKVVAQEFPEAEFGLREGRNTLIVYDADQQVIYPNPMKKYRNLQAWLLVAGFLVLLFGIQLVMMSASI